MDPATASIIAAVISAVASIAVAIITTRDRIGPSRSAGAAATTDGPAIPYGPARKPGIPRKAFRAVGWVLVVFLYIMGTAFLLLGSVGFFVVVTGGSSALQRDMIA